MRELKYKEINGRPCEFIGIQDVNGNDIYEGAVIMQNNLPYSPKYYKIWRNKGGFAITSHQDDLLTPIDKIIFWDGCSDMQNIGFIGSCLMIGNFYQTPIEEIIKLSK